MKTKFDNRDIATKLAEVNSRISDVRSMYFVVKKFGGAGYEVRSSAGVMTGDIGLTKEGVIGALCAIDCVHSLHRPPTSAASSNSDFDKALADLNDEKPKQTGTTPEQKAKFDADLADLLADDEEDAMNSEAED